VTQLISLSIGLSWTERRTRR